MNKRRLAILTGVLLITMALIAAYSVGFAFPKFYQSGQTGSLQQNILSNLPLYSNMLIGILLIILLDLLVSVTLFRFFIDDNYRISMAAMILRVTYSVIFGFAATFLLKNLNVNQLSNEQLNANYLSFETIWNAALMLFGFHLFLIGILMKLHQRIPKILCYLACFAGLSYFFLHIFKLVIPGAGWVALLGMILGLPMALGELALAIWLIIKGGKV